MNDGDLAIAGVGVTFPIIILVGAGINIVLDQFVMQSTAQSRASSATYICAA